MRFRKLGQLRTVRKTVSNTRNLKPFPKGVSGNPGGRPKTDGASIIAREVFAENPEAIKAGLMKRLKYGDPAVFKALADRAFGRLPQPLAVTGDGGRPIEIVFSAARPPWLPK
jgi:hypothetical protein